MGEEPHLGLIDSQPVRQSAIACVAPRALVDLIQTDAGISPGNSGSAMADASGRVLGISVAYVPPQQGAVAVGFAIPAATATRVADELLTNGRVHHAYLGLQPAALTPEIARERYVTSGVLVYALVPDGPAAKAGIRPGDVLTTVGARKITSVEELFAALRQHDTWERVAMRGKPALGLTLCYDGDFADDERVIAPLRGYGPPAADLVQPSPTPPCSS